MIEIEDEINCCEDVTKKVIQQYSLNAHLNLNAQILFRGEDKWDYKLKPSLSREIVSSSVLMDLEKNLMDDFKTLITKNNLLKYFRPEYLKYSFHHEWSLLQQAQHYGLPTRLLDWATEFEKALYFATENPINDNFDGKLWIFIVPSSLMKVDTYLDKSPYKLNESFFYNSSFLWNDFSELQIAEKRKRIQSGRFLIQPHSLSVYPIEKQGSIGNNLLKIRIPKKSKPLIREELLRKGITKEIIYFKNISEINQIIETLRIKYKL